MKLVIVGGTGLIGSKLVTRLREHGHEAVPASPDTGVNTLTGQGLVEVLQGASIVVDVSNSPSFEDAAVMGFFTTSTQSDQGGRHCRRDTSASRRSSGDNNLQFREKTLWPKPLLHHHAANGQRTRRRFVRFR
jgi:hypothetical protein